MFVLEIWTRQEDPNWGQNWRSKILESLLLFRVYCSEIDGSNSVKFVKCDVSNWNDQLRLFSEAVSFTGKVHYVVANAGICPKDEVFEFAGRLPVSLFH